MTILLSGANFTLSTRKARDAVIADNDSMPRVIFRDREIPPKVQELIDRLPPGEAEVIKATLLEGLTSREIAAKYGYSREEVIAIQWKVLYELSSTLTTRTSTSLQRVNEQAELLGYRITTAIKTETSSTQLQRKELAQIKTTYDQLNTFVSQLGASVDGLQQLYQSMDERLLGFANALLDPRDIWTQKHIQEEITRLKETVQEILDEKQHHETVGWSKNQVIVGIVAIVISIILYIGASLFTAIITWYFASR
ncbi:MAG: sigma factor-like helix-turn-helix DNA-binding protein [Anaerolineae bacterium]